MAHAIDPPKTIATRKISLTDCKAKNSCDMPAKDLNDETNVITPIYHKTNMDRDTQLEQHHMVDKTESKILKPNREDVVYLLQAYATFRKAFLSMLKEFEII